MSQTMNNLFPFDEKKVLIEAMTDYKTKLVKNMENMTVIDSVGADVKAIFDNYESKYKLSKSILSKLLLAQ